MAEPSYEELRVRLKETEQKLTSRELKLRELGGRSRVRPAPGYRPEDSAGGGVSRGDAGGHQRGEGRLDGGHAAGYRADGNSPARRSRGGDAETEATGRG